jgi:glucose/arabinose dehydrogenase
MFAVHSPAGPPVGSALLLIGTLTLCIPAWAQPAAPTMTHRKLGVRPVVTGLALPTGIAFLGANDLLVLEKNSGRVMRVTRGVIRGPVLDLGVNAASERGLLGIALHPEFPEDPGVYLFWTCRTAGAPADSFVPGERSCSDASLSSSDTDDVLQVPLLANRVDRFRWTGSTLEYERNLITLRAFQNDGGPEPPNQGDDAQPARGNHDGGVIRFGPDGKLYVLFGDVGRRGQLQNLPSGPTETGLGPTVPDDQFGGPQPDDAHVGGVILRLEDDGRAPADNPFFTAGQAIGGEVGANLQKIFAYGIRNSFGMAFDPVSGELWAQENGEDAFDELNRVTAGMNGGWIQLMGPSERVAEYRQIETTSLNNEVFPNLQQFRWGPERIATNPAEALARLFVLPGSHYDDPEFSWKNVIAPAGIGFVRGGGLGRRFRGDLFVGVSVPTPEGGPLFRFRLTRDRRNIAVDDPRLTDRVADNPQPYDLTESESLVIGKNFGIVTDVQTAPNGNLFVVSLLHGAIYEVFRKDKGRDRDKDDDEGEDQGDDDDDKRRGREREHAAESAQPANPQSGFAFAIASGRSLLLRLPETSQVRLTLYDVRGREVARIRDGTLPAGEHVTDASRIGDGGSALASGVYFARVTAVGLASRTTFSSSRRLVMLR